ncbi:hypothetical protein P9209_03845 [Prescottella defluvii]|nr:hypothetical protein P9209_03845 [Prescottella defluvii]
MPIEGPSDMLGTRADISGSKGTTMSQQKYTQHRWVLVAAAALGAVLLGGAIGGCAGSADNIDSNAKLSPRFTTSKTSTPENPSGLQLTNSFGYIPTHGPALETAPIEPEGGTVGGGTLLPDNDVRLPTGTTLTTPTG